MVRIESGGSIFLRRVSAKIKRFMPGSMAKAASISLQPPLRKLVRVGILLNKSIQTVPDHQPCTSSFSNVKTWGSLVPWYRSARQGTRCPFIKRETCCHTLDELTRWWSAPTARHACRRSPPDLRPSAVWKRALRLFSLLSSLMIEYYVLSQDTFILNNLFTELFFES